MIRRQEPIVFVKCDLTAGCTYLRNKTQIQKSNQISVFLRISLISSHFQIGLLRIQGRSEIQPSTDLMVKFFGCEDFPLHCISVPSARMVKSTESPTHKSKLALSNPHCEVTESVANDGSVYLKTIYRYSPAAIKIFLKQLLRSCLPSHFLSLCHSPPALKGDG